MSEPVTIIGSYISPYVRKVLVCLAVKRVFYRIDPIVPFFGNDEFTRLSPVRRIPVLVDGQVTLPDSTVICEYLEERYPQTPMFPETLADRARARWLEEYADTRMGEVFIWRLFNQVAINRHVWGEGPDQEILRKTFDEDIPEVLDYLESQVPGDGYLFGHLCVADVAIASFFRNAAFARYAIDAARWPKTAAFVARVLAHPAFLELKPFEELSVRTPMPRHRDALEAAGAPLTETTLAMDMPRRGMLSI
ncbi:MAG: glutathione S-transferase family protein [Pseudomonadales bacterium]